MPPNDLPLVRPVRGIPAGVVSGMSLSLTDDVYLRSYNGARLTLGIPLAPMER